MRAPEATLGDITGSAIREVIGKNELDFILTEGRAEIAGSGAGVDSGDRRSYGAGITVYEVNLQEANFPGDVEASVQDAIKAREDKERMSFEAQAYANDIVPNARGAAQASCRTRKATARVSSQMRKARRVAFRRSSSSTNGRRK